MKRKATFQITKDQPEEKSSNKVLRKGFEFADEETLKTRRKVKVMKGPGSSESMEMPKLEDVKETKLVTDGFKFEANPDFSFSFDQPNTEGSGGGGFAGFASGGDDSTKNGELAANGFSFDFSDHDSTNAKKSVGVGGGGGKADSPNFTPAFPTSDDVTFTTPKKEEFTFGGEDMGPFAQETPSQYNVDFTSPSVNSTLDFNPTFEFLKEPEEVKMSPEKKTFVLSGAVGSGEEGEKTMFSGTAKLYLLTESGEEGEQEKTNRWVERGRGKICINVTETETTGGGKKESARLVMRRDGTFVLLLNALLFGGFPIKFFAPEQKSKFTFSCVNSIEREPETAGEPKTGDEEREKEEIFLVSFREKDVAKEFFEKIQKYIKK